MVGAPARPRPVGPDIPADIEPRDLNREVRAELRALPKGAADTVAAHLVAAGRFLDTDPALALQHAQAARAQAARIASVREAVGLAAYHAGEWKLAIAELRAWRRFTGSDAHLPLIADSERALGRPEKAVELATSQEASRFDTETRIELLIVGSGARLDQGDVDEAIAMLRVPELRSNSGAPWVARLRYAYAELLLGADRTDEAREWFVLAADADTEGDTDAGERVLDLDGFLFTDQDAAAAADEDESADRDDHSAEGLTVEAVDAPDDENTRDVGLDGESDAAGTAPATGPKPAVVGPTSSEPTNNEPGAANGGDDRIADAQAGGEAKA